MSDKQKNFLKEFYYLLSKYNAEINFQDINDWLKIDIDGEKPIDINRCGLDISDIYEYIKRYNIK